MIQQDFGHLICQPKVPIKFENLPILRDFRLKSHIFESCHLDQMQNGLDAKFDAFKPFFCALIFPAKDGFFSKMPTFSGMCQRTALGKTSTYFNYMKNSECPVMITVPIHELKRQIFYDTNLYGIENICAAPDIATYKRSEDVVEEIQIFTRSEQVLIHCSFWQKITAHEKSNS